MKYLVFADKELNIEGVLKEEVFKHSFDIELYNENKKCVYKPDKDTVVVLASVLSSGYCSPYIKKILDMIGACEDKPMGLSAMTYYTQNEEYGRELFLNGLIKFCELKGIVFGECLGIDVEEDKDDILQEKMLKFARGLITFLKSNRTMLQDFEWYLKPDSKHWQKVACQAKDLKKMGIDSVWLPPAYKGAGGVEDVGYAVYDLYDLGEFYQKGTVATKYGTIREYLSAVRALQREGIEVLADIVLGHKMGADEKERIFAYSNAVDNRNVEIQGKKKITVWTKFTFPGRNGRYSDFKWDWTNFHGTDYDAKADENGIYRFIGKEWDTDVDNEFGNYDYLMGVDLDMSDPEVVEELKRWGEWYYETTGVDGFRIDAVKHIDFNFFKNWLNHLRSTYNRKFFAVGEYWNSELPILINYIEKTEGALTIFDVPLHFNLHHASTSFGYYDMRNILKDTVVSYRPDLAVTFVDNHDTQPGQALESFVLEWFKPHAYSLILLRDMGIPCVFYGDLYGIEHDNIPKTACLEKLLSIRKHKAYGTLHDYFDDPKVIGFTREGIDAVKESGLAVIMTIEKGSSKKMYVGKHFAGLLFECVIGDIEDDVKIDKDGFGEFTVNDGSVAVYLMKEGQKKKKIKEEFKDENEVGAFEEIYDRDNAE